MWSSGPDESRGQVRQGDFQSRYGTSAEGSDSATSVPSAATPIPLWPVDAPQIGQSVLTDRDGKGRPHQGVDLFVPGGSPVRAVRSGQVRRVVDGRNSPEEHRQRAGLFVDILGKDGLLYRYLHLGSVVIKAGTSVKAGARIGTVAEQNTSGAGRKAHLHLEIRKTDWKDGKYGLPIDPLTVLAKK